MTATIEMREEHLAIVRDILRQYLPAGARVLVFGSRVLGGARQFSDLDLAIEWDRPIGLDLTGQMAEAFSEFDLPFKVDIVDLSAIDPRFRARIAATGPDLVCDRWRAPASGRKGRPDPHAAPISRASAAAGRSSMPRLRRWCRRWMAVPVSHPVPAR